MPQERRSTVGLGASLSFYVSQVESIASGDTVTALCGPSEMNFKVEETAAWQIRHNRVGLWGSLKDSLGDGSGAGWCQDLKSCFNARFGIAYGKSLRP